MILANKPTQADVVLLIFEQPKKGSSMRCARLRNHLFSAVVMALAFSVPAAANEVESARASYVAALAAGMQGQDSLSSLEAELAAAEGELAAIRTAKEQSLAEALAEPQAALLAAEANARDLRSRSAPGQQRIDDLKAEIAELEARKDDEADAAAVRQADISKLKEQLEAAIDLQRAASAILDNAQSEFDAAKAAQLDFAPLTKLAATETGLQDPQLREYIWRTIAPTELVGEARLALRNDLAGLLNSPNDDAEQFRLDFAYSSRDELRFEDVPQGDAWLLWDLNVDAPAGLPLEIKDTFEQLVLLRVAVSRDTDVDAADLPRVSFEDIIVKAWATDRRSEYDACLDRLDAKSGNGAFRQICQRFFPKDARYDVVIRGVDSYSSGLLMSGAKARAFASIYRSHLTALHGLAIGELPAVLLSSVQADLSEVADELDRKTATKKRSLESAQARLNTVDAELSLRQQEHIDAVEADATATAAEATSHARIMEQLEELQDELAAEIVAYDREVADLADRLTFAEAMVSSVKQSIVEAKAEVEDIWVARELTAENTVTAAKGALISLMSENEGIEQTTKTEREQFLVALARSQIEHRVYFDMRYSEQICLRLKNNSGKYAQVRVGELNFRGNPFKRSDFNQFNSLGFFNSLDLYFLNRYSERVSGLIPGQTVEDCSYINDPRSGQLGRHFDSIGGFSEAGWGVGLDVRLGTFSDTATSITIVPNEVIFSDDLAAALDEAIVAYRRAQPATTVEASIPGGVTSEIQEGTVSDGASNILSESSASDAEKADVPAEPDTTGDQVVDLDRTMAREVQEALNKAGFDVGQPDGVIGPRSEKAIAEWQTSHGHVATGTLTNRQVEELLIGRLDTNSQTSLSPAETENESEPEFTWLLKLTLTPHSNGGLEVEKVDEASEAFEKGLRVGDIITEASQQKVDSISDFEASVGAARAAGRRSILLLVRRAGSPFFIALSL